MKKAIKLIISILICQGAGLIGSVFTASAIPKWYAGLAKPGFTPPNWVFAPIWTILFLFMGVSLYLVWEKNWKEENAIAIFGLQLGLNVLWSIVFFGLKAPDIAFVIILMLFFAIMYTIVNFYKISRAAAFLLLPYIFWVSFAAVLNLFIVMLNWGSVLLTCFYC